MRVLVVGDSFFPASVFAGVFDGFAGRHSIEYLQVEDRSFSARTVSERRIGESFGSPDQLIERMAGTEVLVVHGAPVTDEVMDASEDLRFIGCARGGPVNVDVVAATERGLPVVTTPGKNADAVADQTLAFMVMLARRFPQAQRYVLEGGAWGQSNFEGAEFMGHDLRGHTLGLVGIGNVGRRVADRASSFGMQIVAFDPYASASEEVEQVAELEELVSRAHFVSLHARATHENENLFDETMFSLMQPGSYFINTARETLVDEDALDRALERGQLAGVALDIIRPRAQPGPHPLLRHKNVVITPHIGGATHETLTNGATTLAHQITRYTDGQPLENIINPQTQTTKEPRRPKALVDPSPTPRV